MPARGGMGVKYRRVGRSFDGGTCCHCLHASMFIIRVAPPPIVVTISYCMPD